MNRPKLIQEFNSEIYEIYMENSLIPLRGLDYSYMLNGKQFIQWYHDVITHCSSKINKDFNYFNNLDDLLFCSDEIIYFTAHLFLYLPYINTPLKNPLELDNETYYFVSENLAGRRYDMFVDVCFEKVYNYWDRIGDLIASFYPTRFKGNVYFSKTIKELELEFNGNPNYNWLRNFVDNEFTDFNQQRIDIVHNISKNTQQNWNQLWNITDYEKSKVLTDKILFYADYFKQMNELCKTGFEKTLYLLEDVNTKEKYNCG